MVLLLWLNLMPLDLLEMELLGLELHEMMVVMDPLARSP
jgi:hypothetical protein